MYGINDLGHTCNEYLFLLAKSGMTKLIVKIRGVDFVTNLIFLDSKSIHVTLGMDWLSKYMVPIKLLRSP
jgi:hypothetical protein